jgi:hypothetical protein
MAEITKAAKEKMESLASSMDRTELFEHVEQNIKTCIDELKNTKQELDEIKNQKKKFNKEIIDEFEKTAEQIKNQAFFLFMLFEKEFLKK